MFWVFLALVLVAGLLIILIVGLFATSRSPGALRSSTAESGKTSSADASRFLPSSDQIPYGVDRKPMPQGDDVEQLLPEVVGVFRREPLRLGGDVYDEPIYASYAAAGTGEIFMELGLCGDPSSAQRVINVAQAESADVAESTEAISIGTEPSFLKLRTNNPRIGKRVFLAWTRGGYYFSATATSESALEKFMTAFPH